MWTQARFYRIYGGEPWWPKAKDRWRTLRANLRTAVRLGDPEKWLAAGAPVYGSVDRWLIQHDLEKWISAKCRYR